MPRPQQEKTETARFFASDLVKLKAWGPTPALALRALLGQSRPIAAVVAKLPGPTFDLSKPQTKPTK